MTARQPNPGALAAGGARLELFTVEPLMQVEVGHGSSGGTQRGIRPHRASGARDHAMGRTAHLAWASDNAASGFLGSSAGKSHFAYVERGGNAGRLRRAGSVA